MTKKKKITNDDRQECEVYSRIVGYIRPVGQWNDGKSEEYQMRKEYSGN